MPMATPMKKPRTRRIDEEPASARLRSWSRGEASRNVCSGAAAAVVVVAAGMVMPKLVATG